MTIVGSLEAGFRGDQSLLLTKSVLDGFTSIALAGGLGVGVLFSVIPLFIFQAGLTFVGHFVGFLPVPVIDQMVACGGVLIIGVGINLLDIKKVRVISLLPSIIIAAILSIFLN